MSDLYTDVASFIAKIYASTNTVPIEIKLKKRETIT